MFAIITRTELAGTTRPCCSAPTVVEAVIAPTVDPLAPMHAPFFAKQPAVISIPLEPVEVAERLKRVKSMPPVKVEVAALVCQKGPTESSVEVARSNCDVEDANIPYVPSPLNQNGVDVPWRDAPKFVVFEKETTVLKDELAEAVRVASSAFKLEKLVLMTLREFESVSEAFIVVIVAPSEGS